MGSRWQGYERCHQIWTIQKLSLLFLSASVQCWLWAITTTVMSSHLWPLKLKCSPTGSLNCLVLLVESSAEVTCLPNVSPRPNGATYDIDASVCVTRRFAQYFVRMTRNVATKTVLVLCLYKGSWCLNKFYSHHWAMGCLTSPLLPCA